MLERWRGDPTSPLGFRRRGPQHVAGTISTIFLNLVEVDEKIREVSSNYCQFCGFWPWLHLKQGEFGRAEVMETDNT